MSCSSGRNRQVLKREGRIVLYLLLNASIESKKRCLGYELAVTVTDLGKIERSWLYEASESSRATDGFDTLVDAQQRNVLGNRSAWKRCDARSRPAIGPRIVSLSQPDGLCLHQSQIGAGAAV
jgi:hypothetical protein